ncbi:MAG: hypothetical protein PHW76_05230 [Alphaproteobacteria bacterium]|nr:hypothetical protein [Alphaproteobacteria bacterium]
MEPDISPTSQEVLDQEFNSIHGYLQTVCDVLAHGSMPDILDLDDRIARLCALVESAPEDLHEGCLARLGVLLKNLGDCEDEMTALHNAGKQDK